MSDITAETIGNDLPVSEQAYYRIYQETKTDPELILVQKLVMTGWPQKLTDLPESAKLYYSY